MPKGSKVQVITNLDTCEHGKDLITYCEICDKDDPKVTFTESDKYLDQLELLGCKLDALEAKLDLVLAILGD